MPPPKTRRSLGGTPFRLFSSPCAWARMVPKVRRTAMERNRTMGNFLFFNDNEDVFGFLFHQIFLPRKFFQGLVRAEQFFLVLFNLLDFSLVKLFFTLQVVQLGRERKTGDKVIGIQESDPNEERHSGQKVKIAKDSW